MLARLLALLLLLPVWTAYAQDPGVPARLVKITQVDANGKPIGPVSEFFCPSSGCQQPLVVLYEGQNETYMAAIDVVLNGIYVALTSRTLGTDQIIDFATGQAGPVFVATRRRERVIGTLRFIVVRDASVRAERGFDAERQLSEGTVFNRNRRPDLFLRVEVLLTES
jgi:hypothetical protein